LCNRASQRIRVHVIDETPSPVDLDDRNPLAVLRFELAVPVDRDLAQLETELVARSGDDAARRRAEMAPRRRVEDDLGYG
jgi:hypothetical protein